MSYIGLQLADNTNLLNTTVTATGPGNAIDISGYATALVQISGNTFSGVITFERSLDNIYWSPALVTELNALNQKTQIDAAGLYFVRSEAQYIRYNVTNITGSANIVIDATTTVVSNADKVAWAMDETNNTPLNVKLQLQNSGIKQDLSGAFILSDNPQPVTVNAIIGNQTIIDTTGYQSIQITTNATFAATAGVQYSSDGITFTPSTPLLTYTGTVNTVLAASSGYVSHCLGRFAKIVCTTAGSFTYTLRSFSSLTGQNLGGINGASINAATAQLGVNVANIGNVAVLTGGVNGSFSVGGTSAVGVAPVNNPLVTGGVDPTGLARRLSTTMLGDLVVANRTIPSSNAVLGSATTGYAPIAVAGYNNQIGISVQDTSNFEGQLRDEILAQILQELKILNQQIYELPRIQAAAFQGPTVAQPGPTAVQLGDEPTQMRNDASLFSQQQ
jgi:hypothetical protein